VNKKTQTLVRLSDAGRQTIEGYWKEMEELRESAAQWRPPRAVPVPSPS
jgi:hypothetical protein